MKEPPWTWDIILEQIRENRCPFNRVVAISKDIVDYFTDLAKATDLHEMGGFLLGDYIIYGEYSLTQFYDYIQARNTAENPTVSFRPDEESIKEVCKLMEKREYTALSHLHTHPGDTYLSIRDLVALLWSEDIYSKLCKMQTPPGMKETPDFIVTGGGSPFMQAYHFEPFCIYWGDENITIAKNSQEIKTPDNYFEELHISAYMMGYYELGNILEKKGMYFAKVPISFLREKVLGEVVQKIESEFRDVDELLEFLRDEFAKMIAENNFAVAQALEMLINELMIIKRTGTYRFDVVELAVLNLKNLGYEKHATVRNALIDLEIIPF